MTESKKYYWLKLKRDFFKRHDIRIIESMPNGKDYILFYLKLLVESVDHDGALRFSDAIPYDINMLSVVTNTNADIVKSALEIFANLQLIDILDDKTIFMNEVSNMIGSAADNDNAKRQQRFRERQKAAALESGVTKNNAGVTGNVTNSNERKRKSIEKEKEKEREKDKNIINKTNNIFLQMQGDE
jgi:predicted phage replisome organizer